MSKQALRRELARTERRKRVAKRGLIIILATVTALGWAALLMR